MAQQQYVFGTGAMIVQPVGGGSPIPFGTLMDVSVDISADIKELNGQFTYPVALARGKSKVSVKATNAAIDVVLFNQIFFGNSVSTTSTLQSVNAESHSIPAVSTYTVTVTNSATFVQDQGVVYSASGVYLVQVASAPTTGQYSVAAGVYTFAAADAGKGVNISYTYTAASTGHTLTVGNQLMGLAPTFQCVLSDSFNNSGTVQTVTMTLYSCVANKFNLPLKADDFLQTQFEFSAQANSAGNVFQISQST